MLSVWTGLKFCRFVESSYLFQAFLMNNLGMKDRTRASKIWEAIDQNIEKQV